MSEITENESVPILELNDVAISYMTRKGAIEAASGISFKVHQGETVGLVGESGCGKSTVAFGIVNFLGTNGRVTAGSIKFQGEELVDCSDARLQSIRGNRISMVFQDPMQALNPSLCIGEQLSEVLTCHQKLEKADAWERSVKMLERVYMPDPVKVMDRYPHQLSGGQQQRVVIAMAMLNHPTLLIMDEPTTGLDVLVQEQILRRVREIRAEVSSSIILITHDIAVIAEMSDRISIMYGGKIVESATAIDLFESPFHPYTLGLKNAFPSISVMDNELISIPGTPPALIGEESGCLFEPRCPFSDATCAQILPQSHSVGEMHQVSCHRHTDVTELREKASKKSTWHC